MPALTETSAPTYKKIAHVMASIKGLRSRLAHERSVATVVASASAGTFSAPAASRATRSATL